MTPASASLTMHPHRKSPPPAPAAPKKPGLSLVRVIRSLVLVGLGLLALLACFQARLLYFPRKYGKTEVPIFTQHLRGERLEVKTGEGLQVSYWLRPVRQEGPPRRLWLVCAGNGTLALEFVDAVKQFGEAGDDFLFLDFPGYGECEGSPSPAAIKESILAAVVGIGQRLKLTPAELHPRLRLFGHSLGAACCLLAAQELDIRKGVLLSPFTSTMDMAQHLLKFPAGFLVWHRFDNAARLQEILSTDGEFWIFHGSEDEVIPVEMSRELARLSAEKIHYTELPGVHHNDIVDLASKAIGAAFQQARE